LDLVYVNHSRTDAFEGFSGRFKRAIVRARLKGAMRTYLRLLQSRLAVQGPADVSAVAAKE